MANNVVVYQADGKDVSLSPEIVKGLLVSGDASAVTPQEVAQFIRLCQYQGLNPFLREAYLIKFGTSPATIVTGKYVFTKRAASHPDCAGWQSGTICEDADGNIVYHQGAIKGRGETLIGGWCDVRRKSWSHPMRKSVMMDEYARKNGKGELMRNWKEMPATMIEKVATVSALREAFPDALGGLYDADEMPVDATKLDRNPVEQIKESPVDMVKAAKASLGIKDKVDENTEFYTGPLPGMDSTNGGDK